MNILGSLAILQLRRAIEIKEQIAALEHELQQVTEGEAQDINRLPLVCC